MDTDESPGPFGGLGGIFGGMGGGRPGGMNMGDFEASNMTDGYAPRPQKREVGRLSSRVVMLGVAS